MSEREPSATGAEPEGNAASAVREDRPRDNPEREKSFTQQVINEAQDKGWQTFHLRDRDSIHIVRGRGFPDLVMYRKNAETGRTELIAAELKRDADSIPTDEQREWMDALGQHVWVPPDVWRPEDWAEIERVLRDGPANAAPNRTAAPRVESKRSHGQIPANFGGTITGIVETIEDKDEDKGDAASLRRMNPDNPDSVAFWRLMVRAGMPGAPDVRKWGLIVNGMAIMAHGAGLAHKPKIPVGRALYRGSGKRVPVYSEHRLSALLAARGTVLHRLLERLFRMLASEGCGFDWREMAWFILNEGENEDRADRARIEIARAYYRAEGQHAGQAGNGSG